MKMDKEIRLCSKQCCDNGTVEHWYKYATQTNGDILNQLKMFIALDISIRLHITKDNTNKSFYREQMKKLIDDLDLTFKG